MDDYFGPEMPNPVADNQDVTPETLEQLRARLDASAKAIEEARRVLFDVLASVDDGLCAAHGCCMPANLGSMYCGEHEK